MKNLFFGTIVAACIMTFTACSGTATERDLAKVSGTVTYLQRIALPPNAKITVSLADVSLQDSPMEVISSKSFVSEGRQVPFPFTLYYSKSEIDPSKTYAVQASIEVDGKLMFTNDTAYNVITDPAQTVKLGLTLKMVDR
ncbi:YbaY family lipoprotein [Veronia pacifica]|uniref:Lipoprotein-related protein n=1 Tax=Veronia pacifica TaxID=1080227 RepID=A0A1C3E905_9GAMM|nr:YbaY family lipoprotein [Veronia pacifica]ODA29706.1 lipoprotein-related protein [Veronia pacifica]